MTNARYTVGDIDACEAIAMIEGFIAYANQLAIFVKGNARKAAAIIEGRRADARYTIGDADAREAFAIIEGRFADARHAIGNGDARKTLTIIEGTRADKPCRRMYT